MKRKVALLAFGLMAAMTGQGKAAVFYPPNFTLSNGLEVVVVPNHMAPVVSQMVWYKVGAADEERGRMGLAHYLEHLMFRGTANIPPDEFSKLIAAQGGEDNAFTSYDYTAYFEQVAADRLPMIMHMEADRMQNLRITPETASPELHVVLDERQQRTDNDPGGRFTEKFDHLFMPHYAYGRPVIGWKKEIEKLTAADAEKFYAAHYAPNNAVVVISGDVSVEEVMRLAAATYGSIPRLTVADRKDPGTAPQPEMHDFTMKDAGVEQPQILWRFAVPSYATQKDAQAYAYEVLA
jgi:zinc protease